MSLYKLYSIYLPLSFAVCKLFTKIYLLFIIFRTDPVKVPYIHILRDIFAVRA